MCFKFSTLYVVVCVFFIVYYFKPVIGGRQLVSVVGSVPAFSGRVKLFQKFSVAVKDVNLCIVEFRQTRDVPIIVVSVSVWSKEFRIVNQLDVINHKARTTVCLIDVTRRYIIYRYSVYPWRNISKMSSSLMLTIILLIRIVYVFLESINDIFLILECVGGSYVY